MIATSIEQSKRLLELGINPESADMHYNVFNTEVPVSGKPFLFKGEDLVIPAWSLSALLDIMPKTIDTTKEDKLPLNIYISENKWVCCYGYLFENNYSVATSDNQLINASIDMIEWLVTYKYIEV